MDDRKNAKITANNNHSLNQNNNNQNNHHYKKTANHELCDFCQEGGDILCCDRCPASFHLYCKYDSMTLSSADRNLMMTSFYEKRTTPG